MNRRNPDLDDAADSILDVDTIWTVGGGFGVVVLVMAVCGVALAGWSLRAARGLRSRVLPHIPAVRARERAERIAAASADLPDPSTPAAAADDHVVVDTQ